MKKTILLVFFAMLFIGSCGRNLDDEPQTYTYDGKTDVFCGGLIYVQQDNVGFLKPINLDSSYFSSSTHVNITFTYTGDVEIGCGGFVGNPKKIKIINIKKL